jgi:hypothetical protein
MFRTAARSLAAATVALCLASGSPGHAQPGAAPTSQPTSQPTTQPATPAADETATSPWAAITPVASFFVRFDDGYGDSERNAALPFRARLGLRAPRLVTVDGADLGVVFVPQVTGDWLTGFAEPAAGPALGLFEGAVTVAGPRYRLELGRFPMR